MQHLKNSSKHGTVMGVSMMKDEAPFLLEWFAHHLAVGFTDILVYTNDCSDGTVEMLQRLEELGLGYHRPNDIPEGQKPQPSALNHAQAEPLVRNADWVLVFDADEFLAITHPSGTLEGMLDDAVAQGANGIVITWRIFGSGGVVDWSRAPVTEQYTRAAPPLWNKGWGVKTLFKFDHQYWKLGIHRPSIKNKWLETDFPDSVKWLNGSGRPMEDYFKFRGWRSIRRTIGYDWAQMNHYAVKSVDSYAVRKFRGNVNNKKDKYNADYWSLQDRNEVEDTAILRHAARRAEIVEDLLKDPVLNELHFAALERVEKRLDDYRKTEAYQQLKDSLIEAGKVPITQVEAKPPQPRDPAKIAALMSRVEKKVADQPKDERRNETVAGWAAPDGDPYMEGEIDISGDIAVEWVANHEIELPADPRIFAPEALSAVLIGRFERRHARNIAGYLSGCSRVLEIGAGIGFIPMRTVQISDGLVYLGQDSRAALIEMATRIAAHNGITDTARLKLSDGPLRLPGDGADGAGGLAAYLHDFRPDALRIARPGDLPPELLAKLELKTVRRVVIPFVSDEQADEFRLRYAPVLRTAGFAEDPERATSGSLQFDRCQ
ncbi:Glycosyl transferase, group 2 family protein [Roseibacterium elongatum DSM 19469]|uniref:Glycosyl transferase, group 2 family protein n=1 Tax=Roseicyclus elongatus DSM 19469 TaxID=1294273 RepID=W8RT94_9RHOB|nr:glycosyltransferase family 2 protein [Roseibacterium elongatum]AHM04409.1 Glycosyl transferase, group 2 family protein [Roseibacterium elongatum DSM 19469]